MRCTRLRDTDLMEVHFARLLVFGLSIAMGCSRESATSSAPAFEACGGALTGTWVVVEAEYDSEAAIQTANGRLSTACNGTFKSFTLDAVGVKATFVPLASGSMTNVSGRVYQRTLDREIEVVEELLVSGACVDEQFGGAECGAVGDALRAEGAADCSAGGPPCSCTVTRVVATSGPETVSVERGQITTHDDGVYEYCQEGDTLEQVKRDASGKVFERLKLTRD